MNINKLTEGQELKSYRELCDVLGLQTKGGNQKKAQMKEIQRYIKLNKGKGFRLIVDEIYDVPKVPQGSNIYGGLVQLLLTDYFMKSKKTNVQHTKSYLMQQVSLINKQYRVNKLNTERYSTEHKIHKDVVNDFYDTTDSTLGSTIETALKNLENNALILYTVEYMVKSRGDNAHRVATDSEKETILATRHRLLNELGYKTLRSVLFSKHAHEYQSRTAQILMEKINVTQVYRGYDIHILQDVIAQKQTQMILTELSSTQNQEYQTELNNLVIRRLLDNAVKRHQDANEIKQRVKDSFAFGNQSERTLTPKQRMRISDEYIDYITKMIDQNISLYSNDLKFLRIWGQQQEGTLGVEGE